MRTTQNWTLRGIVGLLALAGAMSLVPDTADAQRRGGGGRGGGGFSRGGGARGGGGMSRPASRPSMGTARTSVNRDFARPSPARGNLGGSSLGSSANRGLGAANRPAGDRNLGNPNRSLGDRNLGNANRNLGDRNVNRDVNRNVNRDINRNIDADWNGGWGYDNNWHPLARAAAWGTAAAVTAAAIGSTVYTLPVGCSTTVINGITYENCGGTWYEPRFVGDAVSYVVVTAP